MYVQNKLVFFALGKSPNYDIARDLNLIPEVGHLATASSSSLLQNYIKRSSGSKTEGMPKVEWVCDPAEGDLGSS